MNTSSSTQPETVAPRAFAESKAAMNVFALPAPRLIREQAQVPSAWKYRIEGQAGWHFDPKRHATRNQSHSGAPVPQDAQPQVKPSLVLLDIDGVLLSGRKLGCSSAVAAVRNQRINPAAVCDQLFLPAAKRVLKDVHDQMNGALSWIISSTWRETLSRSELCSIFRHSGLGFVADNLCDGQRWRTPPKFGRSRRFDEIAQWLDQHHQGEPFVILDDSHSGASLRPSLVDPTHPFAGRTVLCEHHLGLTGDHVPFIVEALRRPAPRPMSNVAQ